MQAQVQEYEETASGARHIHLATDNPERVFLVAFPTVPGASDGRAHILEHLALCGSARYPVRDPFFAMLRRSTAHFMNAMTYPDKTVYPFASTDRTDFFNLLDVYLDAVFFPRLDYLDFLQEGWRLELDGNRLAYQGIVFNEMKGAFADPLRALDSGIAAILLAGTTYAVESGGDPIEIPSLTHAALKDFHAQHYHPSQAVFMTAGCLDPREVQDVIEQRVLATLSGRMPRKMPQLAPQWTVPQAATIPVPTSEHGVQMSWLLGESADPHAYYHAELLEAGLLGNASAPLMRAMESAGFGRPSSLNGTDAGGRQIVFHLGMEGLTRGQVDDARRRIRSALEQAAREGVPQPLLQAALRDMRFGQREIGGGDMPDALDRLLHALPLAMHGGDIMDGFDADAILEDLQDRIADPRFFKELVQQLLDTPTRLDVMVVPDPAYLQKRQQIEDERLAALQAALEDAERQRLRAESAALLARQRQPVNNDALPRIRPADVSPLPQPSLPLQASDDGVIAVSIPSNGISYAHVLYEVSGMDAATWPWLRLYADLLPDLGLGDKSYEEADAWRHDRVPHFDVDLHVLQTQEAEPSLRIHVDFHARGLREENKAIAEVLSASIRAPRFDEHERLAFLIDSMVQDMRNNLADEGDDYARLAVTAPLSALRNFENRVEGLAAITFYRELHAKAQTEEGIKEIAQRLAELHRRIIGCPASIIAAGVDDDAQALAAALDVPRGGERAPGTAQLAPDGRWGNAALHAPAQVNHCYAAWQVPGLAHPDAPVLAVLGEILTNLVLHQALREEGGAYGGHASYSASAGIFAMMSYRDPRLAATYADFGRALEWLKTAELTREQVEEAIICVIQHLDRPRTPYEEVMQSWERQQQGISEDMRRRFRQGVLRCSARDIKAVAARWLDGNPQSRAAFVGSTEQDLAGLEVVDLVKLAN